MNYAKTILAVTLLPGIGRSTAFLMIKKYGKTIALKGNVDCAQTLTFGTRKDVIEETKKCIGIGAPGGGYILSSSNSIHSFVKPENFAAMLETHKIYGNYTWVFLKYRNL